MNWEESLDKYRAIIILDSNFILLPYQFKIDYLREISLEVGRRELFIIFHQVLDELHAKKEREPRAQKFPRLLTSGLDYIEKQKGHYNIWEINKTKRPNETTDDFLLRMAKKIKQETKETEIYLATNDAELRKKVKKQNIGLIFLRQNKYLDFLG